LEGMKSAESDLRELEVAKGKCRRRMDIGCKDGQGSERIVESGIMLVGLSRTHP
jgi:hypothetical protein